MSLPERFCWTRFGTEAGQAIDEILKRKEEERVANGGIFFWGIGNALGPSMRELLRRTRSPQVLFSPMKSAARADDVAPPAVVAWTSAETLNGDLYPLPDYSLVASRHDPVALRSTHYALVCFSDRPLGSPRRKDKIALTEISNLLTGRPVGASQTTAIVQRKAAGVLEDSAYEITIRAKLVFPYFLTLRDPMPLSKPKIPFDWGDIIRQAWQRRDPGRAVQRSNSNFRKRDGARVLNSWASCPDMKRFVGKVILLTGAAGTGKSTLVGRMQRTVDPLRSVDYGQLLLERLQQRTGSKVSYTQLRKLSSDLISHRDVENLDTVFISQLGHLRRQANVIIDSHAVTKERYGYRITPYSAGHLKKLQLDAVICLHCDPAVLAKRIRANPAGRLSVSPEEARHHQFLQEAVASVYGIVCGCPVFIIDNTTKSVGKSAKEFLSVLDKIGATFRMVSRH
jgi:adenylate kinase